MLLEPLEQSALRRRNGSKWSKFPADVLATTPAESDFDTCPAIAQALASFFETRQFGYPLRDSRGPLAAASAAFAAYAARQFDWHVATDDLLVLGSATQAIIASILAFSEPGAPVLLQTPAFPAFLQLIEQSSRRALLDPLRPDAGTGDAVDIERLGTGQRPAIWLLCHPHNPTGHAFTRDELAPYARLAEEHGIVILSDELHADIRLDGARHEPFVAMFPRLAPQTVTIHSPSKTFSLGGLGCAVLHFGCAELKERFACAMPPALLGEANLASLAACTAAWRDGAAWTRELILQVRSNRDYLIDRLARELPQVRIVPPDSTYFVWADFEALAPVGGAHRHLLERARVATSDGRLYGPQYASFARFVLACSDATVRELTTRIIGSFR